MNIFRSFDNIIDEEEVKLIEYRLYDSKNMKAIQASGAGMARIQYWIEFGTPFMLCTAYRFLNGEVKYSIKENKRMNAKLAQDLKNNGYSFIQVEGSWVYWIKSSNFLYDKEDELINNKYGEVIYQKDDNEEQVYDENDNPVRGVRIIERSFFVMEKNKSEDKEQSLKNMIEFSKHICKKYEQESVLVAVGERGEKQPMGRTTLAPVVIEVTPEGISKWNWQEYTKFSTNIVQEFWTRKRGRVFAFASVYFYEPSSQFDAMGIKAMGYLG